MMSLKQTELSQSKRSFLQAVFCCGFLMLSLTHATSEQTTVCDIGLLIPKHFHTSESETMEGNGNINNRSLSAWNWTPHTSAHRIPGVIFEATCQSHHCSYPSSHHHTELNSVPIYSTTLVLTQNPKNRKCFTVKFQRVVVGCTCVWAKSLP
ncbi:interleukin 17a/f2 [Pangasianodon hypophthalmus]|uniref:interleukin 17a/f2 n=1 Tax=Pangasianodon hypophthalmus TaxID=310915 RepID=UPI00147DDE1C|nr:interleukin 17a/f2 [Pangasianodon hypophthalmus]